MSHDQRHRGDDGAGPDHATPRGTPGKRTRTQSLPARTQAPAAPVDTGAAPYANATAGAHDNPFAFHVFPTSPMADGGPARSFPADIDADGDGHADPFKATGSAPPASRPPPAPGARGARPAAPAARGTDHARELAGHGVQATTAAHTLAAWLVPAYVAARDALDLAGLQQLAADIYRAYESIATVEGELAPYLRPFTADDQVTPDQAADQGTLAPLAGSLGFGIAAADAALADHLGPVAFRGVAVPGAHLGPMPGNARLALGRIVSETIRTGGVIATVVEVRDLVPVAGPMSPQEARTVADKIAPLASRPVHFTFVKTALRALGLWHLFEHTTAGDGRKLAQVDHDAKVQADRFGAGADLGGFHPDQALALLRPRPDQPNDYEVSEGRAAKVLALVETVADPAARGGILEELHRLHLLEPVVELAPFAKARRLHDGLPPDQFKRVRTILRQRFEGKDTSDPTLTHLAGKVPGGSTAVAVANFCSVGWIDAHDEALRAERAGEITESQCDDRIDHASMRTAVVGGLSYATGGAFGSFAEGLAGTLAATGTLGRVAAGSMVGAAGGAGGAVGARAGGDIVDGDLSSPGEYGHDLKLGAGFGAAIGGGLAVAGVAGSALGRRVPARLKTPIHWIAEQFPRLEADPDFFGALRELGARQSKGFATFVTSPARALQHIRDGIAETSADVLATFQGFGPDAALAGGGRVRLTIEARGNLREPGPARPPLVHIQHAERLGDDAGDLADNAGPSHGSLFDDYGDGASYADDVSDWHGLDSSGLRATDDAIEHIGLAEPEAAGRLGSRVRHVADRPTPDQLARERGMGTLSDVRLGITRDPRHHVLPQEEIEFFQARGFPGRDIDNFTIEIPTPLHDELHGLNQALARKHWPEREWNTKLMKRLRNEEAIKADSLRGRLEVDGVPPRQAASRAARDGKLTRHEILEIAQKQLIGYDLDPGRFPFVPYGAP